VNALILHPATLRPVGERRISPIRPLGGTAEGGQELAPDGTDSLSALPSSLPATRSEDISRLPAFPESANRSSALRSSGFSNPLRSASRPPSHDFLDHVVLADENTIRRRKHHLFFEHGQCDEIFVDIFVGQRTTSHGSLSTIPASGNRQTFPETPSVISPMFSPGVSHSRACPLVIPDSSPRRHASVPKSLLGRGRQASQRLVVGRSASTKSPMRTRVHKKSSRSKLRQSSARNSTSSTPSSLPTVAKGDAPTTSDRVRLDDQPTRARSLACVHSPDVAYSRRSALQRRCESQRKTIILPVGSVLPPPPPSLPPSPQKTASLSSPASPSSLVLPPPPPPPKLHLPPLPASQVPSAPPADDSQARVSQHSLPPPPSSPPPATPSSNPLAAPPAYPGHARVNSLSNTNNIDRPPRPLGPRPPYRNASSSPVPQDARLPSPSGDSSSRATPLGAQGCVPRAPSTCSGSIPGPKFQTPPPKFKGLTLEAAKWTFSSEELQAIVSQAIRQSGQASSIRLLPQQAAFVEVPEELEKLNSLMHELRVQYRLQVRKRDVLLGAINAYAEGPEFSSVALRAKLQELHETAVNLDGIAEELYRLRDQAGQLSRMLAVHQGSALAMALRKLHTSFLKRKTEVQSLKDHVHMLETERDEAWTQAQQVARDLDDLNAALQNQSRDPSPAVTRAPSRSSSRAVASRKSYLRVSRAGLRLSVNQLASLTLVTSQNGSRLSSCCPSAVCTPSPTSDPVPPVPPIPDRPSLNLIITSGLSSQNSGKHRLSSSSRTHITHSALLGP